MESSRQRVYESMTAQGRTKETFFLMTNTEYLSRMEFKSATETQEHPVCFRLTHISTPFWESLVELFG
jgi:hypothetical protein